MKTNAWSFTLLAGSAVAAPWAGSWEEWNNQDSSAAWGATTTSSSTTSSVSSTESATPTTSILVSPVAHSSSTFSSASSSSSPVTSSSSAVSSAVQSSSTVSSSSYVDTWSKSSASTSALTSSTSSSVSSSASSSLSSSSSAVSSSAVQSSSTVHSTGVSSSSSVHSTAVSSSSSALSSATQSSSTVHSTGVSSSSSASSSAVHSSSSAVSSALKSSSSVHSTGVSSSTGGAVKSSSATTPTYTATWGEGSSSSSVASSSTAVVSPVKSSSAHSSGVSSSSSAVVSPVKSSSAHSSAVSTGHSTGKKHSSSGVSSGSAVKSSSSESSVTWTGVYSPTTTVETTVTDITTVYTTVVPVTTTKSEGKTTKTSTFETTETLTTVIKSTITLHATTTVTPLTTVIVTPVPVVSAVSTPLTTVTQITTAYTTVVPVTKTHTTGQSTSTVVVYSTSTLTGVFISTITIGGPTSVPESVSTEVPLSVVPWGSATFTYALSTPITFPTLATNSPTWGNWGGNDTSSAAATGSAASGSAVSGKRTSSVSVSGKPKTTASKSKATGTASKSKATGSAVSSIKPTGSAISKTSSSSSTSTCSTPTPTPGFCIPCEGQPGSDPDAFCGYTVNDDSYKVTPKTCRTVTYDFTITNTTFAPDGIPRIGLLINGQFPGPLIEANWGDTVVVNLHNAMQDNGTSIHFHGTRQWYTNEMDGVPSITQCPLAPGQSMTYSFVASNYGSSWYHSHFSLQIQDGVQGPMIVHGPASAEYDDEQFLVITDWNHVSLNELYDISEDVNNPNGGPPTLDTGLINGMNVWGADGSSSQVGQRFKMSVTAGKSYRLRLVNSGAQTSFKFYIDQHVFQVIAADYVPITPYTTNIVNINCGQRYDIVFKADQPVANYWARADGQNSCIALKNALDIKAIISYDGASDDLPTSTAYGYETICEDEPLASLVPVFTVAAGSQDQTVDENILIGGNGGTPNLYKWTLSGTTFTTQWDSPTLEGIYKNGSIPDWSGSLAINAPNLGEWIYIIIESPIPVPHPIHLHGHDFLILAQGYGGYSSSVPLNTVNPARRDTALMPAAQGQAGYLVIAFETDNPGAWLIHCHIIWHAAMGLALQIVENLDGIKETVHNGCRNSDVCDAWHAFDVADNFDLVATDSGI